MAIEGNTIPNMSVMAAWGKSNVETSCLNDVYSFFKEQMFLPLTVLSLAPYVRDTLRNDVDGSVNSFTKQFLHASDFNISDIDIEDEEIPLNEETCELSCLHCLLLRIQNLTG